jgi:hypothetical protein
MRLCSISASTLVTFALLQELLGLRGVNRIVNPLAPAFPRTPSIHPKHKDWSNASEYVIAAFFVFLL